MTQVRTNLFEVTPKRSKEPLIYYQYEAQICRALVTRDMDENGEVIRDEDGRACTNKQVHPQGRPFFDELPENEKTGVEEVFTTDAGSLSRRILTQLKEDMKIEDATKEFCTDGSRFVISTMPLFENDVCVRFVKVRLDVDDGEEEQQGETIRTMSRWYHVELKKTTEWEFSSGQNWHKHSLTALGQCFNHMLRSSHLANSMRVSEKNPRLFFVEKELSQNFLMNIHKVRALVRSEKNYEPLLGLLDGSHVSGNVKCHTGIVPIDCISKVASHNPCSKWRPFPCR